MASAAKQISSKTRISEPEKIITFSAESLKAPFLLRCAALMIDYMVVLALPVSWLVLGRLLGEAGVSLTIGTTVWILSLVLVAVNFLLLPLLRGQSLGKMIVGLTILRTDGTDINLGVIFRRHVLGYLVTILTFGVGFLLSAFNESGRSLHDLIAGTVVVRGRKTQV